MPSLLAREVTCNLLRVSSGILAGLMEITSARKSTVQLPKAEPTHIIYLPPLGYLGAGVINLPCDHSHRERYIRCNLESLA